MKTLPALLIAALVLAGCGGKDDGPAPGETFDVRGTATLVDPRGFLSGGSGDSAACTGTEGYDDVESGAPVVVTDAQGRTLATGSLKVGIPVGSSCEFAFTVPNVPAGQNTYSIEVANFGEVSFGQADAKSLALTVG